MVCCLDSADTRRHTPVFGIALAVAVCVSGCSDDGPVDGPGGRTDAAASDSGAVLDAAPPRGDAAQQGAECQLASDCRLVPFGCCAPCAASAADYFAVPEGRQQHARREQCPSESACGTCPMRPPSYGPKIVPQCIEGRCQAVDLTRSEDARCDDGSPCERRGLGCCPCIYGLEGWVALRQDAFLDAPYGCAGAVCDACDEGEHEVHAFCGASGYCELELVPIDASDAGHEDDAG